MKLRTILFLTALVLLGLFWVLNEMKPAPRDTSYFYIINYQNETE